MSENEIKPVVFDGSELRHGCVQRPKRWSGDTHDDLGGSVDEAATDALMAAAADAIDRLTAERDVMIAERDRIAAEATELAALLDRTEAERVSLLKAVGNEMLERFIEKHGEPVPLVIELEAYKADAERYRWLRDKSMMGTRHDPAVLKEGPTDCCEFFWGAELDEAIDAARAEGGV